ncbi:MAG: hypothetical protein V7K38_20100 [Nostoc sp.]|uniref:hypothetical protein n=1 Tax=Nostoc sp. TaxID=1180 RepID=UPI002FF99F49
MATHAARRTLSLEQSYYVRLAEQYRFFALSLHFLRSALVSCGTSRLKNYMACEYKSLCSTYIYGEFL